LCLSRSLFQDLRTGDLVVEPGARLTAASLGLLAAVGAEDVDVVPPARVGILSTGDELVRPPGRLGPGRIYDSNAVMLAGQVREAGAEPVDLGTAPDDPGALLTILDAAAPGVDVLLCSGGVSAGGNDPVRGAFAYGDEVSCLRVAMKPGGPQAFGFHAGKPFFGLPGNPVSAFVSFEVFVRPALRRMMALEESRPRLAVCLQEVVPSSDDFVRFVPSRLVLEGGTITASPCARHSNLLAGLAQADALVEVPARSTTGAVFAARLLGASSKLT
jgi:molybdopterin molybdotransferase